MRRMGRGLAFASLVGVISIVVCVGPALFIQSIFVGSVERCDERQRYEEAAFNEITTTCGEDLMETPYWFPLLVILVGGSVGTVGGFVYGFFGGATKQRNA